MTTVNSLWSLAQPSPIEGLRRRSPTELPMTARQESALDRRHRTRGARSDGGLDDHWLSVRGVFEASRAGESSSATCPPGDGRILQPKCCPPSLKSVVHGPSISSKSSKTFHQLSGDACENPPNDRVHRGCNYRPCGNG